MSTFADAEEFHTLVGDIIDAAMSDPEIAPALARSGITARFSIVEPTAALTADFANLTLHHDAPGIEPDAELVMSGETANRVWQGKESLPMALSRGRAKIFGSAARLLSLLRVAEPLYAQYVKSLQEAKRHDLIVPW